MELALYVATLQFKRSPFRKTTHGKRDSALAQPGGQGFPLSMFSTFIAPYIKRIGMPDIVLFVCRPCNELGLSYFLIFSSCPGAASPV